MPYFLLKVAYEGSEFAGWSAGAGQRSVASTVADICARLNENGTIDGCSRTDAGVHAQEQLVRLHTKRSWNPQQLAAAIQHQCPADLSCLAAASIPANWHFADQVVSKTYAYRLDLGPIANPFLWHSAYRPRCLPNPQHLQQCAQLIPGTRNWVAFARRGEQRDDLVRHISDCHWQQGPQGQYTCMITGTGFIYRQVRSLVGAMIAVANGTCSSDDLIQALAGHASPAAKQQAPPRGLALAAIALKHTPVWASAALSPSPSDL